MSSTEPDSTHDAERRKFDDVASLFGPIVPPAGSPVRPRVLMQPSALPQAADADLDRENGPHLTPPPTLRAAPAETLKSRPPAEPRPAAPPPPVVVLPASAPVRPDPKPEFPQDEPSLAPVEFSKRSDERAKAAARTDRKAAADVPWPDAFSPRPNYKPSQKSRLLYWLFLIPFAIVVAVAVTFVDPRSIRSFIDQTLPQYLPAGMTQFFARPAPDPSRPEPPPAPQAEPAVIAPAPAGDAQPTAPASAPRVPASETVPVPQLAPSLALPPLSAPPASPAPAEQAASPPPAAPVETALPTTVPVAPEATPAPASSEPSLAAAAPQAAPEPAASAPPPPANDAAQPIPLPPPPPAPAAAAPLRVTIYYRRASENEARRVASKIANAEIKPSPSTARSPMIYYFNPADREAATTLGRTLAGEGASGWIVRAGPTRPVAGAIDILLP